MRIKCKQPEILKPIRERFNKTWLVGHREIRHGDVLKVKAVLSMKLRVWARYFLKTLRCALWRNLDVIDITSRARQAIENRGDKSSKAVNLDWARQEAVDFR